MPHTKHDNAPLNVPLLLQALTSHQIRFVIVGSVAVQLYGVKVDAGDFDITPSLDYENLIRLAKVLLEIEATLPETDEIGAWQVQPDGEKKWVSRKATPDEIQMRVAWVPDPHTISTFDNLFYTCYGNFDVVPDLAGDYDMLMQRAQRMTAHAQEVWVAHVDELLAALTVPRRQKDIPRVRSLRDLQRRTRNQR